MLKIVRWSVGLSIQFKISENRIKHGSSKYLKNLMIETRIENHESDRAIEIEDESENEEKEEETYR